MNKKVFWYLVYASLTGCTIQRMFELIGKWVGMYLAYKGWI